MKIVYSAVGQKHVWPPPFKKYCPKNKNVYGGKSGITRFDELSNFASISIDINLKVHCHECILKEVINQ